VWASRAPQVVSLLVRSMAGAKRGAKELPYPVLINAHLPDDIRVVAWAPVDESFNARYALIKGSAFALLYFVLQTYSVRQRTRLTHCVPQVFGSASHLQVLLPKSGPGHRCASLFCLCQDVATPRCVSDITS
jgi:hypothetical protein